MINDILSPVRKKYDIFSLSILGFALIGAIPMGFCEKLEGFFLIYFIIYLTIIIVSIILLCIAFPFVRKSEIKFFKNKFSIENMEKLIDFNFEKDDYFFYVNGIYIELTSDKIKDLSNGNDYPYITFKIYATYQCGFAGEIYKVFINFENENQSFSLQLDSVLYSLIKYYKIQVDYLDNVLDECENNLNIFFNDKKLRKQVKERQIFEEFKETVEPYLKLFGAKAYFSDFVLNVIYHNDLNIEYDFRKEKMYINETYYYNVEEQDLFEFLSQINNDKYYVIEYKKRLSDTSYFKLSNKNKTDINQIRKIKRVLSVVDINYTVYKKKQTN